MAVQPCSHIVTFTQVAEQLLCSIACAVYSIYTDEPIRTPVCTAGLPLKIHALCYITLGTISMLLTTCYVPLFTWLPCEGDPSAAEV